MILVTIYWTRIMCSMSCISQMSPNLIGVMQEKQYHTYFSDMKTEVFKKLTDLLKTKELASGRAGL